MEVTSSNFEQLLPQIKQSVENATFLAIDCEFSGLNAVSEGNVANLYDSPHLYYEKIRKNSMDFLVVQYGLSAFRFDVDSKQFKQQTYNFYIFRKPTDRIIPDQRFLCQASSIDFLISQGFDFNKMFKFGIPYLNNSEENKYRDTLKEKHQRKSQPQQLSVTSNVNPVPVPEENKEFLEEVLANIESFLESDGDTLEFSKCNAFMRKLIYQAVDNKPYKAKLKLETKVLQNSSKDRVLVVNKVKSQEEEEEISRIEHEKKLSFLDDFVGFSKVLKIVIQSEKLIVGHNICLDFLHTIDKFLTPLPEQYEEFKQIASSLFSKVIDTKYMSSSDELRESLSNTSTILKDLLDTCSKDPFRIPVVELEEGGQGYSVNDGKEHEAGYDAYITGLCFLSMWTHLGESSGLSAEDTFKDLHLVQPFLNKLYVFLKNIHINLSGDDPNPSRDHVFYMKFPKDWTQSQIVDLFSPFGGIQIFWINDCSAYICLYKKENAKTALKALTKPSPLKTSWTIMSYKMRQNELSGVKVQQQTNRKRPSLETTSTSNKKMRTDKNYSSKTTVNEDEESEDELTKPKQASTPRHSNTTQRTGTKRTHATSQIFEQNNDWGDSTE